MVRGRKWRLGITHAIALILGGSIAETIQQNIRFVKYSVSILERVPANSLFIGSVMEPIAGRMADVGSVTEPIIGSFLKCSECCNRRVEHYCCFMA
jgi:hypothetical protein